MSYLNLRGKQVWGSSVYRLEIVSDKKRFASDFSGSITLFERRHESSSKKFEDLVAFIAILRDMWETVLPNAKLQDARVARWLEEYLSELGVRTSYSEAFDAMRGKIEEVQTLEISEEKKLEESQIEKLIEIKDDFIITGITKSIKGDLTDMSGIEKILTKFLDDNKPSRNTFAISKIAFKDSNSQLRNMEERKTIVNPILNESISLWTGFNNTFSEPIQDIEIIDIIPYSYKLLESKADLESLSKDTKLTEDGLQISWKFSGLQAGEKVRIDYALEYRMMRTILIRDDNDITLLHTYEDLIKDGNNIWVESSYTFKEKTNVLENVKILDQFPSNYQFISSTPDVGEPLRKLKNYTSGTEIEWTHTNVAVNTQFIVSYDLKENERIFRDKIKIQTADNQNVADIMKIVRPLSKQKGYGIIIVIDPIVDLNEIIITDRLSMEFKVEPIHADIGDVEIDKGEVMQAVKWKIHDIRKGKKMYVYYTYLGPYRYDLNNFNVILPTKTSMVLQQEVVNKNEKLVFPFIYQSKVDI